MGKKKTSANDVHQIASKVWIRVWIAHLSSHKSLFLFQLYIYLCSGWVTRWAPICHWSQSRSDRNRTSSLSQRHSPPFSLFPPFSLPLCPPLRLMQIVFLWISLAFLGQVLFLPPPPFPFRWWHNDRKTTHYKKGVANKTNKKKSVRDRESWRWVAGEERVDEEHAAHRGRCTSRDASLFNQILAGGWFAVCDITFNDFFMIFFFLILGVGKLFAWIQRHKSNQSKDDNRLVLAMAVTQNKQTWVLFQNPFFLFL